jgi:hypothetical protein
MDGTLQSEPIRGIAVDPRERTPAYTSPFATQVGNGFELKYDSVNPLVNPQFSVPAIDGKVLSSFDANNDLHLRFFTDLFPSHGIEVTLNGVVPTDVIVNDASCLDQSSVLGLSGISLLSYGLSSVEQNTGTVISGTGTGGPAADLGPDAAGSRSCPGSGVVQATGAISAPAISADARVVAFRPIPVPTR